MEKTIANCYINELYYYSFNTIDYCIVYVRAFVSPNQVELEYEPFKEYRNQRNMTVFVREVIKDIFEENFYNGLKVRNGQPVSSIDSIFLSINPINSESLVLSRKIGFNNSLLTRDEYFQMTNKIFN